VVLRTSAADAIISTSTPAFLALNIAAQMVESIPISSEATVTAQPAASELLPLVYQELRKLAAARLSQQPPGQTLQATALVHEAYLRLVGAQRADWNGRTHFFSAAAEAMRHILVDNARRKRRVKHGGDLQRVSLDQIDVADNA